MFVLGSTQVVGWRLLARYEVAVGRRGGYVGVVLLKLQALNVVI